MAPCLVPLIFRPWEDQLVCRGLGLALDGFCPSLASQPLVLPQKTGICLEYGAGCVIGPWYCQSYQQSGAGQVQGTRRFNGTLPNSIQARGNATNAAAVMEPRWLGRLVAVSGEGRRVVQESPKTLTPLCLHS